MKSFEYVLKHDFGYGEDKEQINKLLLRNMQDLQIYVRDVLDNAFKAKRVGLILQFDNRSIYKIIIVKKILG